MVCEKIIFKVLSVHKKTKSLLDGMWTVELTRRNKAAFSNVSGVVSGRCHKVVIYDKRFLYVLPLQFSYYLRGFMQRKNAIMGGKLGSSGTVMQCTIAVKNKKYHTGLL